MGSCRLFLLVADDDGMLGMCGLFPFDFLCGAWCSVSIVVLCYTVVVSVVRGTIIVVK